MSDFYDDDFPYRGPGLSVAGTRGPLPAGRDLYGQYSDYSYDENIFDGEGVTLGGGYERGLGPRRNVRLTIR
jgi:hypothetical protein